MVEKRQDVKKQDKKREINNNFVNVTMKKKVAKKYKLHGGSFLWHMFFFRREYLNLGKMTL